LAISIVAVCLTAHGQAVVDDAPWLERSRRLLEEAAAQPPPPWLRVEVGTHDQTAAQDIAEAARLLTVPAVPLEHEPQRILIFASFSLPRPTLMKLLEEATAPNVVLVLRGVPARSTVPQTIRRLRAMLPDATRVPQVILDPTLFRRFEVERVPTLVLERGAGQRPIHVRGAVTVAWLRRMASAVTDGAEHLGRRAEDYEIAEADLMQEMQQRLASIDWAARRKQAASRFWLRQKAAFVTLPEATGPRSFTVNPSVRVTADIHDAEGHRLVTAGDTFNPLQYVPLTKTVIVFQGTSPHQVTTAVRLAQSIRRGGRGVILLTTDVDTDRGWDHLGELEHAFQGAVYLLPQGLVQRFHIERIPATVASRGHELVVSEVPVTEAP
jgi:conjugal transfer pilus assembly protein TraW